MMDQSSAPAVGVALLNWNNGEDTCACIRSLRGGTICPGLIIVVDNGSTDGSKEQIKAEFPDIDLITNETNQGFAAATNQAVQHAMHWGADYIWVLNNDTEVDPDCLGHLLQTMIEQPGIAAISAKILYHAPTGSIWYAGGEWDPVSMKSHHRGQMENDRGQYDAPGETDILSGCCMFIRRDALEKNGLLAGEFFAYMEDTDWCLRAREKGLQLYYQPAARMRHKESASVRRNTLGRSGGRFSPLFIYLTTRNHLWIIRRHATSRYARMVAMARCLPGYLKTFAITLGLLRLVKTAALLRGIRDGLIQPCGNAT